MEIWTDTGIVLSARSHGEGGAVVSILTAEHGRHAGYMNNAKSSRSRGLLEPGNTVSATWKSRISENLGTYALELEQNAAAHILSDPLRLSALQSACAIADATLAERESHPVIYNGFLALLDALQSEVWGAAYVYWELALLKELGFGLDLSRCAGGGDPDNLMYVSPRTGRAVSEDVGEPYKERLLPIPDFLKPEGRDVAPEQIMLGLDMTYHFMEYWVFAHGYQNVPDVRKRFQDRFAQNLVNIADQAV